MRMTKSRRLNHDDLAAALLDEATLEAGVGGAMQDYLSPQLALAAHPVGGRTFKDVFAKPTLGTYH
jgi:hypothetical protein